MATGHVLFEWRSNEHVGLDEPFMPQVAPAGNVDYFHLNSIDVDTDGNLLLSARNTSAIYKVDRKSGEVLWRLGGKKSDFTVDPAASFAFQHDVRRRPDGTITIFDNNAAVPGAQTLSRGMRINLDMKKKRASLVTEYLRRRRGRHGRWGERPATRGRRRLHRLGHGRVVHGARAGRERSPRRTLRGRQRELSGLSVRARRAAEGAAGDHGRAQRGRIADAPRQLERLDPGGEVAARRGLDSRRDEACVDGAAYGLRDGDPAARAERLRVGGCPGRAREAAVRAAAPTLIQACVTSTNDEAAPLQGRPFARSISVPASPSLPAPEAGSPRSAYRDP